MLVVSYYFKDLPNLADFEDKNNNHVVQINFSNGNKIKSFGKIYDSEISYYQLPQNLINAVIATEDRRFFSHRGVDIIGIIRAFVVNYKEGRIAQGGSTISQQLAKMMFLKPERNFKRKIQEALLAIQLERKFSKEQILLFYLNRAYFGAGNYGIKSAAKNYFKKDVKNLNLNESAILAGLLKAPSKLSPKNNKELAEERANVVLKGMIDAEFLDDNYIAQIDEDANYNISNLQYLYFADYVYEQLPEDNQEDLTIIEGTLDEDLQANLDNILEKFITKNSQQIANSEIAVIIMEKDGAIKAMAGGKDYQKSQFNRAIYAKRQAGSVFKTLVYLTAFEEGFTLESKFIDKKINVGAWLPNNYNDKYFGEVTLKEAFAKSLNSVAIQLQKDVGGKKIAKMARKLGINSKIDSNDLTTALGTNEVTLLEITSAYATILGDGVAIIPYFVNKIENSAGKILYQRESSGLPQVVSQKSILQIKEALAEVIKNGTGKIINTIGNNDKKNIYGKTGTSQNYRDAWFIGFGDKYVIGVWIGNDDNSPTKKIVGGSLPAEFFGEIINKIE